MTLGDLWDCGSKCPVPSRVTVSTGCFLTTLPSRNFRYLPSVIQQFIVFVNSLRIEGLISILKQAHSSPYELKIHFFYAGNISDFGFNNVVERNRIASIERFRSLYGLNMIRASFSQKVTPLNMRSILSNIIANNVTHVVVTSASTSNFVLPIAHEYPELNFTFWAVSLPEYVPSPNIQIVRIDQHFGLWLAGYTCAKVASQKVGIIAPSIDPLLYNQMVNSFTAGAKTANSQIKVGYVQVSDFSSPISALAGAKSLEKWGAGCITSNQNNFKASAYYSSKRLPSVGITNDKRIFAGEYVVTSIVFDLRNPMDGVFERIFDVDIGNITNFRRDDFDQLSSEYVNYPLDPFHCGDVIYKTKRSAKSSRVVSPNGLIVDSLAVVPSAFGLEAPRYIRPQIREIAAAINNKTQLIFCGKDLNILNILKNGQVLVNSLTQQEQIYTSSMKGSIPPSWCLRNDDIYDERVMVLTKTAELVAVWTEDTAVQKSYWSFTNPMSLAILVCAAILTLGSIFLIFHMIYYRKTKVYTLPSWNFLMVILVSTIIHTSSVPAYIGEPTRLSCNYRVWAESIGLILFLSAVAARNIKVWRWAKNGYTSLSKDHIKSFTLSNWELFMKALIPSILGLLIILVLWSSNSPIIAVVEPQTYLPFGTFQARCKTSTTRAFTFTYYVYMSIYYFLALAATYAARNTAILGDEVIRAGVASLNAALLFIIGIVVHTLIAREYITAAVILWIKLVIFYVVVLILVFPKWYLITISGTKESIEQSDSSGGRKDESSVETNTSKANELIPQFYSDSSSFASSKSEASEYRESSQTDTNSYRHQSTDFAATTSETSYPLGDSVVKSMGEFSSENASSQRSPKNKSIRSPPISSRRSKQSPKELQQPSGESPMDPSWIPLQTRRVMEIPDASAGKLSASESTSSDDSSQEPKALEKQENKIQSVSIVGMGEKIQKEDALSEDKDSSEMISK